MISFILVALLLGLDSYAVSAALGTCGIQRQRRNQMACAFGLCDAVASALGLWLGVNVVGDVGLADWAGPALVGLYGVVVLTSACWSRSAVGRQSRKQVLMFCLPLVMSLDNLGGGLVAPAAAPAAVQIVGIGLVSGWVSWIGFRTGELVSLGLDRAAWKKVSRTLVGGLTLVGASLLLAIR